MTGEGAKYSDAWTFDWVRVRSSPDGVRARLDPHGFFNGHWLRAGTRGPVAAFEPLTINKTKQLILLADPGSGKSHELRRLEAKHPGEVERLDLHVCDDLTAELLGCGDKVWLLDALDEYPKGIQRAVAELVKARRTLPNLAFTATCRSSAWSDLLSTILVDAEVQTMAPLSREDVRSAATRVGVDATKFFRELSDAGVETFATRPLELKELLHLFKSESRLPRSRFELMSSLIDRSVQESNENRERGPVFQRRVTAQRLAGFSRSTNRAIATNKRRPLDEDDSLHVCDVSGGLEPIRNRPGQLIVEEDFVDLFTTALFQAAPDNSWTWTHAATEEFLAAEFVAARELPIAQLQDLLFVDVGIGTARVVPRLTSVAAWISTSGSPAGTQLFDALLNSDPHLLLQGDLSKTTDDQRRRLTEILLTNPPGPDPDHSFWSIRGLEHSTLDSQLIPLLD